MSSANQINPTLRLLDNRFGDPAEKGGQGIDISWLPEQAKELLSKYAGKSLNEWVKFGVVVSPDNLHGQKELDDGSADLAFFTLASNHEGTKTWINTSNCMGVVKLRNHNGNSVQIEIGSRFDNSQKQFFLTYLLSKVFGGSMIEDVDLGTDSIWDMLLAFVFRRRLLEASAVGLFKQYQTFHHNDARIRGRIDVTEHLRRNIPFCGKVAYSTHEITFNNPTNHLIRYALAKASRKWGRLMTGDGLMDVRHDLEQNTPTWQPGDVANCIRRKENRTPIKHPFFHAVYEPLRQVSLAILRDEGASLYQQHQEAEGVIFDGSWLWEEYLWTLLKPLDFKHPENKKGEGGWQTEPGVTFYPDFFHEQKRVVLDAKYRRDFVNQEVRQDEAKQVFAYMFLLDAVGGGLIKPEGNQKRQPITRQRRITGAAHWHNFVLKPSDKLTAKDYLDEMHAQEEAFQNNIRERLTAN
ncbi:MAG: hypothetical protein WCH99_10365 [Verrucomicrobiota bacterium]